MDRIFYVYTLAGKSAVLYTGVTNDLARRVQEHQEKQIPGFTETYNVTRLVWFEAHSTAVGAIAREKQIKRWARAKKVALIGGFNPRWRDLSSEVIVHPGQECGE
jgi:putative endonuclease